MDPNANLAEQLTIAARINAGTPEEGDADRLAELVEALNEWVANGGALPAAWETL